MCYHYTNPHYLVEVPRIELGSRAYKARALTIELYLIIYGGGDEIRTHAPIIRPTGFQDQTLKPLEYSSMFLCSVTSFM